MAQIDLLKSEGKLSDSSQILDVGCGFGFIGAELKARNLNNLYGIEIDQIAREHAAPLYLSIFSDVEDYSSKQFDLILCLDILEHLANPFEYFAKAVALLKPGGHIVVSLPNIAHWSVRFSLLFGRFQYQKRGLLDETHLQFFTRKRTRELIASQMVLEAIRVDCSIAPLELMLPSIIWDNFLFRSFSKVRLATAKVLPGLLAFQNLVLARKSGE